MTIKTWKEEFYPIAADSDEAKESDRSALLHSIHKWQGLEEENLKKHNITAKRLNAYFDIDSETCALCQRSEYSWDTCEDCVLRKSRGGRCDVKIPGESISPYDAWICDLDPAPMIALLEYAFEYLGDRNNA